MSSGAYSTLPDDLMPFFHARVTAAVMPARIAVGRAMNWSVEVDDSVRTKKGNLVPVPSDSGRGQCAPSDDWDVAGVLSGERVESSSPIDQRESTVSLRENVADSARDGRKKPDAELVDPVMSLMTDGACCECPVGVVLLEWDDVLRMDVGWWAAVSLTTMTGDIVDGESTCDFVRRWLPILRGPRGMVGE